MEEGTYPPNPSWFLSRIVDSREDGTLVYGSYNHLVILKTRPNKIPFCRLLSNSHNAKITALKLSPENADSVPNSIVTCSEDGYVKLWNIESGQLLSQHKSHSENEKISNVIKVVSVDFSQFNTHHIISVGENSIVVLWDYVAGTTKNYFFGKMVPTVLSCCPFKEKFIAVGCKSGLVWIIDLKLNQVRYRLRGHDMEVESLSWCPVPFNVFKPEDDKNVMLLASFGKDKKIYLWKSGTDGRYLHVLEAPCTPFCSEGQRNRKGKSSLNTLVWVNPYWIVSTNCFGELLKWDLKSIIADPKRARVKACSLLHAAHMRGVFSLSCVQTSGVLKSNAPAEVDKSSDDSVTEADGSGNEHEPSVGNYQVILDECETQKIWSVSQDSCIIGCDIKTGQITSKISTFSGAVMCGAFSPHDPNKMAIGSADGKIRVFNLGKDYDSCQIFWEKIQGKVHCLVWHPTREGLLAYGTSEGRLGMLNVLSGKTPHLFKSLHVHNVFSLSWGPYCYKENTDKLLPDDVLILYSCGDGEIGLNNPLKPLDNPANLDQIVNLPHKNHTDVTWKEDQSLVLIGHYNGSISILQPPHLALVYQLTSYKKLVQFVTWHPLSTTVDSGISHYHNFFTAASSDPSFELRVFNLTKDSDKYSVEQVATLTGHYGIIHFVGWNPHGGCQLISTSRDNTVQVWDVLTSTPIANLSTGDFCTFFSMWNPLNPDLVISGGQDSCLHVWSISNQKATAPPGKPKKKKKTKAIGQGIENKSKSASPVPEKLEENSKEVSSESVVNLKPKKPKSVLAVSTRFANVEPLNNCFNFLKNGTVEEDSCSNISVGLSLLSATDEFLQAEEQNYLSHSQDNEICQVSLWKGNLKDVLEEKIKSRKGLSDFIVSLATTVSPRCWLNACQAYAEQLYATEQYLKSSTYWLACYKVEEAIDALVHGNLYKEALCIIKCRRPKDKDLLNTVLIEYAKKLKISGKHCEAAECYLHVGDYLEAAKYLAKGSTSEYTRCAALAAAKSEDESVALTYATDAVFKCLPLSNWELCKGIIDDHPNFKFLEVYLIVHKTLSKLDNETMKLEQGLIKYLKEECVKENIPFRYEKLNHIFNKACIYKDKTELWVSVSQELAGAVATPNEDIMYKHILNALNSCERYFGSESPLYELCYWLEPINFLSSSSIYFSNSYPELNKSLRAYLCLALVNNFSSISKETLISLLPALVNDALDTENIKYFKNQLQVKTLEKAILGMKQVDTKNKITPDSQKLAKGPNEDSDKLSAAHDDSGVVVEEHQEKRINGDMEDNTDKVGLTDPANQINNEKIIAVDVLEKDSTVKPDKNNLEDALTVLKREINSFEQRRVITPHPVACYCQLKAVCADLDEEFSKDILKKIEQLWVDASNS